MNCPKCGAQNAQSSQKCVVCGSDLTVNSNVVNSETIQSAQTERVLQPDQPIQTERVLQPDQPIQTERVLQPDQPIQSERVLQPVQPIQSEEQLVQSVQVNKEEVQSAKKSNYNDANQTVKPVIFSYLMYLILVLFKPIRCFKEEKDKLNNPKIAIILSLILAGISTISKLIQTIIVVVRVKSYNWSEGYTYSWNFENMKDINYFNAIGKNFLIYLGIIFAVAILFYIISLMFKKGIKFFNSLSIVATSMIPLVIASMVLSPILGLIWMSLSIVVSIIGFIYCFLILYELINNELNFIDDLKIYFNLICFGILMVTAYYFYVNVMVSSLSNINDILGMFS